MLGKVIHCVFLIEPWKQVADRHETINKLKAELKERDEKLREAQKTSNHRADVIQQLKDDCRGRELKVASDLH